MNSKHHYIADSTAEKGFIEISESEALSLFGDEDIQIYVSKVYRGKMSIDEVPEGFKDRVAQTVANRVERFGEYETDEISADELGNAIKEIFAIKRKDFENFIAALKALAWSGDNG